MRQVLFSTGNNQKFMTAKHTCEMYDINVLQKELQISEIQEEDPEKVALDKAAKAYAAVNQPVIISDDSWSFSGLGGFPGVYMHSMNTWFTNEDFLRLVLPLQDRCVTLTQYLIYTDNTRQKIFTQQPEGLLLKEIRGTSNHPSHTIITMLDDNGLSIAEAIDQTDDNSSRQSAQVWHDFAGWFNKKFVKNT